MNMLFCSAGRRCELMKEFKASAKAGSKLVTADMSPYAPALYMGDVHYLVPRIDDPEYIDRLLEICRKEKIQGITTLIDPEIALLAQHKEKFETLGVRVFCPEEQTAKLCFDKFEMFHFLKQAKIPTAESWGDFLSFEKALKRGEVSFPVFVKPRTGSGSVGARRVEDENTLRSAMEEDETLMVQELMTGADLDADVYVDAVSKKAVSAFTKRKLETRIGGSSKTVSFKDERLFALIQRIAQALDFCGPVDMDFFYRDGEYYLSEINPRFGGAYLHAYGAGVDFFKRMEKNVQGEETLPLFGDYEEGVVMLMYDSVVIVPPETLAE